MFTFVVQNLCRLLEAWPPLLKAQSAIGQILGQQAAEVEGIAHGGHQHTNGASTNPATAVHPLKQMWINRIKKIRLIKNINIQYMIYSTCNSILTK